MGLVDSPQRGLAADHAPGVPRRLLFDEEAADRAVLVGALVVDAGPDESDAAGRAVADPFLRAADDPRVAVAAGDGLEGDGVRAVVGLGQREGSEDRPVGESREPPLLLFRGAEQARVRRAESALHGEDRAQRTVAAGDLHVDEPGGQRRQARERRVLDAVDDEVHLAHPTGRLQWVLRAVPGIRHLRGDLVDVGLRPGPTPRDRRRGCR